MEQTVGRAIHTDLAAIDKTVDAMRSTPRAAGGEDHQATAPGASFTDTMRSALHRVDDGERLAADRMDAVDSGRSDDLVGAMLASQDASLSFSMLMQVRNKVMGAVEDLVKLPL